MQSVKVNLKMWGLQYDENLSKNQFLNEIITTHGDLIVKASHENWVICVPRSGVLEPGDLTIDTVLDHILVPSVSSEPIWYTLSKKQVSIENKQITTIERPSKTIRILFEETFYIEGLKYTVLCIDKPLFINRSICDDHKITTIETLHDCIDFLWSENLSHVLIKLQRLCASFVDQNRNLAVENLQNQKDLIGSLYSQCLQIVLKNRSFDDCDNIKLAVETYMQSCLDRTLIKSINTVTCFSDASLNKIVRNSSDLQLKDLNIPLKFCDIVTNAKGELAKINNYVTILDKMNCLKLTFNHLYSSSVCLTSDDTLQILVFLIVKLNIANWTSNLVYLTHFQFSSLDVSNETNFLVTSLEAALEFIKSDQFKKIKSSRQAANPLFQAIATDDLPQLQELLKYKKERRVASLCHPLCDCDECGQHSDSSHSLSTVNEKGQSLLAFATTMERPEMVEFLLSIGAEVDARDYFGKTALHYACLKGHQDILLILMNCRADVNVKDHDGNSPLHVACNNGHENCVKALFYTSKGMDIDCVNKHGDTALHLAVKWSYVGIVRTLLENKAVASILNKKNQLAMHLAQNYYTERLLQQHHNHLEPVRESSVCHPSASTKSPHCKDHGIRPKGIEQLKKIDLLLKAIENNDFPLTCFYLGFPNKSTTYDFQTKCHPLCNCDKCDDWESNSTPIVDRINVNTCNIDGFTPLHFAAKYGRTELLRVLLDSRALPNLKTYKTLQTPLHLACLNQRLQVVKELVKCGDCEVDAQDYKGNTPLYYACVKNDAKIVEVLLGNGASCDIKNYQGNTIIKEVQEKSLFGVCGLLKGQDDADFL